MSSSLDSAASSPASDPLAAETQASEASGNPGSPNGSLKRLAVRGAMWTMAEVAFSNGVRLAANLVLSRLLFPEAFGISGMVAVYLQAIVMFTDIGTGDTITQNAAGNQRHFLNTVWTLQVVRGLLLTALAASLAYPMAEWWFRKPALAPMLAISSLQLLIAGFTPVKEAVAVREMRFGPLTRRNLLSQVIGLIIIIVLAFQLRNAWALIYGTIASAVVRLILTSATLPGPPSQLGWDREAARQIIHYGRWIFVSSLMTFLATMGDRFLTARYLGAASFGRYNIACMLSALPSGIILMLGPRIIFPAVSRIAQTDPSRLPAAYNRICLNLYAVSLPVIGVLAGVAPLVIRLLYDDRYQGAGWMTRLLAFRAATDCLAAPGLSALKALGHPRYSAITYTVQGVVMAVGIPLAYRGYGITGLLVFVACNGLVSLPVIQWGLWRQGLFKATRELLGVAMLIVGVAAGFAMEWAFKPWILPIRVFITSALKALWNNAFLGR